MKREQKIINVENKNLGRVASRIAVLLRGKSKADFAPNKDVGDFVIVKNIEKIQFSGKKLEQKTYFSHSGYLGGEKNTPIKTVLKIKPDDVLRKAVFGMLPKNKLRSIQIKRLKIER